MSKLRDEASSPPPERGRSIAKRSGGGQSVTPSKELAIDKAFAEHCCSAAISESWFSRTRPMTSRARRLRSNLTDAEQKLWRALRRGQLHGLHFRRQHPIGPYTLDFYCPSIRLAVEVDGGQHAEATVAADRRRTEWLNEKGIAVVRYWNNDVLKNLAGVLIDLLAKVDALFSLQTPSPTLPLSGGGSKAAQP